MKHGRLSRSVFLTLLISVFVISSASSAMAQSITTLFASNNGSSPGGGIYFEVENVGTGTVTINSWDINTNIGTFNVQVWTRPGTYSGFETSSAGWTLLGTAPGVVSAGVNLPTPVAVGGLVINPGEVYGIAMAGGPS